MSAQSTSINLLTAEIRPQGQWDRIYSWTANTAKYIIIVTEVVVLIAIAFRFVVDGKIAALSQQIDMQKQLLDARADEQTQAWQLLASLDSIKLMEESNYSLSSFYEQIQVLIPASVSLQTVAIDINSCNITGTVTSYDTLLQLENNMKNATALISDVTVSANQTSGGVINFSIIFKLKLEE